MAVLRSTLSSRDAIRCSSRSPLWWPSVSFTSLKRSRSISITAPACLRRPAPLSVDCTRPVNIVRLGSPVSPSESACSSFSAAWRRSRCEAIVTTVSSVPQSSTSPAMSISSILLFWLSIDAAIGAYGSHSSAEPAAGPGAELQRHEHLQHLALRARCDARGDVADHGGARPCGRLHLADEAAVVGVHDAAVAVAQQRALNVVAFADRGELAVERLLLAPLRPRLRSSMPASGVARPTSVTSRACSRAFDSARPLTFAFSVCIRNTPISTIGTRQTTPNSTSHLRFLEEAHVHGYSV